ncbi:MAG: DUF2271 domain-containing protein [Gemmatimonadota bacterium]
MIARVIPLLTAVAVLLPSAPSAAPPTVRDYSYHHDAVLGTSLDLRFVTARAADAAAAESVALAEIEQLRLILSSWDSTSELATLVRAGRLTAPSPELTAVLRQYERWHAASGGAYTARVSALTTLWSAAAQRGQVPSTTALAAAVAQIQTPAWQIDPTSGAITLLAPGPLDLNSLGKGFILDQVVRAVRAKVPRLDGGLINIGGDIRTWGAPANAPCWQVGVIDPRDPFDNGAPLVRLRLGAAAISSSGSYARGVDIAGVHHSHIIDPRTGQPADDVLGVTVIATDNATANALSTTLSVLGPIDGQRLLATVPGASALWVTRDAGVVRSPGFAAYEIATTRPAAVPAPFEARLELDLTPTSRYRHRPYVAAWITDTAGGHVRTLAFWGDRTKYQRELTKWWGSFSGDRDLVDAVTRATRMAGQYTLEWDGTDQAGTAMPAGEYVFWLEAAYEDGPHSIQSVTVSCGSAPATGALPSAAAFAGGQVSCGPAATPAK